MSFIELNISLEMALIYAFVSLGLLISFRIIDFSDLTCDGSFVLGSCVCSVLITNNINPYVSSIAAFLAAALAGLITGLINIKFKITDILSGILVAFMLYSLNLKVMGGMPNISLLNKTTIFDNHNALVLLLLFFIVVFLLLLWLLNSDIGLALRAVGQNKRLAKNMGVVVSNMVILGLALSNGLIGLSGALFSQHQGFSDISQGVGTIIIGFAGLVIGEKLFNIHSAFALLLCALLGSIIYRLVIGFALHTDFLGIETQDLNLITGILVIIFMSLPKLGKKSC